MLHYMILCPTEFAVRNYLIPKSTIADSLITEKFTATGNST